MRKLLGTLAATAITVGAILTAASPAQAAPALRFHSAQYDSPGKDTRTNASLNQEWIAVVNTGAKAVNLKGWKISDKVRTYTIGNVTIPGKGGKVYLHTGKGANTKVHLYWNSGTTSGTTPATRPRCAPRPARFMTRARGARRPAVPWSVAEACCVNRPAAEAAGRFLVLLPFPVLGADLVTERRHR